jgi:hypothetical protein
VDNDCSCIKGVFQSPMAESNPGVFILRKDRILPGNVFCIRLLRTDPDIYYNPVCFKDPNQVLKFQTEDELSIRKYGQVGLGLLKYQYPVYQPNYPELDQEFKSDLQIGFQSEFI